MSILQKQMDVRFEKDYCKYYWNYNTKTIIKNAIKIGMALAFRFLLHILHTVLISYRIIANSEHYRLNCNAVALFMIKKNKAIHFKK